MARGSGTSMDLEGLAELKAALAELPKRTGLAVQRRVLLKRAEPLVAAAKANALPSKRTGRLHDSIIATTRRPKGRKTAAARAFAQVRGSGGSAGEARAASKEAGSSMAEVFVGPGRLRAAIPLEFGTVHHAAHPFLRPAWDSQKAGIVTGIGQDLKKAIEDAADRAARKAAKRG